MILEPFWPDPLRGVPLKLPPSPSSEGIISEPFGPNPSPSTNPASIVRGRTVDLPAPGGAVTTRHAASANCRFTASAISSTGSPSCRIGPKFNIQGTKIQIIIPPATLPAWEFAEQGIKDNAPGRVIPQKREAKTSLSAREFAEPGIKDNAPDRGFRRSGKQIQRFRLRNSAEVGNKRTAWRHVQRGRVFPKGRNLSRGKRRVAPEVDAGWLVVSHPSGQGRNLSAGETGGAPEVGAGGLVVSLPSGHDPDGRLGNRCGKEVGVRAR